ncbi:MAG: hypothetical protein EXX96DRAFT_488579 [Benjaminiella poitrasii]|nr:MAG: hypothetical protein EXX96DRAFT_488579 [Benjaminiella poitrasii]
MLKSILSISIAISTVSALSLINNIAIIHGNLSILPRQITVDQSQYAPSYLAPFAPENAVDQPFELIDDHDDLITDIHGSIVSLRKRDDNCQKYHKVKDADNCISVAKDHHITLDEFYDMNPSVNKGSCDNLLTGGTYCVKQEEKAIANNIVQKAAKKIARETEDSSSSSSDKRKLLQKGSDLTYYWIAHPDDYDHSGKQVTVRTCDGDSLGTVSQEYADALVMEGTGIIGDKIINLGGCSCSNYRCFMEVNKKEDPYGLTSFGSPLRPFITIAANDIKRNTKIYVPQIDGWEIPGTSKRHNGCLLVDDRSWSFDSNHIDFYVYRERNYRTLNSEHKVREVDVYEGGDCNLLNYN